MTRFALGAKWGRPGRPPGRRSGAWPGSTAGREAVNAKERAKRTDADASGRQPEQLPPRQVQIEGIGIHGVTAW